MQEDTEKKNNLKNIIQKVYIDLKAQNMEFADIIML